MVALTVYAPSPAYAAAAMNYQRILDGEGRTLISAFNAYSFLPVKDTEIFFRVSNVNSTYIGHYVPLSGRPVTHDSLLSHLTMRWGVYLLGQNKVPTVEYSHNQIVCLFLYDMWFHVFGMKFADEQKNRSKLSNAEWNTNWDWALKMSATRREDLVYNIMLKRYVTAHV